MKKITLLLSFIACVLVAQAQTLLVENFDYPAGALIGQGGWAISGTSTTNPINVTDVSTTPITYTGYPASGTGKEVSIVATGQDVSRQITTQTSGSVYFSLLVNLSAAQATGDYFIHLGEPLSTFNFFGRVYAKLDGSKIAFGIVNSSGTGSVVSYSTSTYDLNVTYLLVVKVDVVSGASSLIINPQINSTEPTSDWIVNATSSTVPTSAGIGEINIRQGNTSNAPTLKLDGIRVATSWAALFTSTGLNTPTANNLEVSLVGKKLTVTNSPSSNVEIFSALGAKIQTVELVNGSANLDLSKGLYIVRAGKKAAKIMIQK